MRIRLKPSGPCRVFMVRNTSFLCCIINCAGFYTLLLLSLPSIALHCLSNTPKKIEMLCVPNRCPGIDAISFERHIGMLTVAGTVELELATIIKKLKKSSIQALPWDVRSPTVSLARTSVEEAAPTPNSTLRRSLIFRVWDRICSLQLRVQDCFHPSMP